MVPGTDLLPKLFSNFLVSHVLRFLFPLSHLTLVSFHLSSKTSMCCHTGSSHWCSAQGLFTLCTVIWGKKRKKMRQSTPEINLIRYLSVVIMKHKQPLRNLAIVLMANLRSISYSKKKHKKYDHFYLGILFREADSLVKGPILTFTYTYTNQNCSLILIRSVSVEVSWRALQSTGVQTKPQHTPSVFECLPLGKSLLPSSQSHSHLVRKTHSGPAHPHPLSLICLHFCFGLLINGSEQDPCLLWYYCLSGLLGLHRRDFIFINFWNRKA